MITAILTAAGLSSRMGRPKPLLPWRGAALIEYQVSALLEGGADEVIAVLGYKAAEVAPRAQRAGARCVVNDRYEEGRTSSIKAGLAAASPDTEHVILLGVDQPRSPSVIARVVQAHVSADARLTSPRHEGRGGHPLMFSARLLPELRLISERRQGLREVFERHRAEINPVHFDDPAIRLDLNTPEAYREAYRTHGQPPTLLEERETRR